MEFLSAAGCNLRYRQLVQLPEKYMPNFDILSEATSSGVGRLSVCGEASAKGLCEKIEVLLNIFQIVISLSIHICLAFVGTLTGSLAPTIRDHLVYVFDFIVSLVAFAVVLFFWKSAKIYFL